MMEQFVTRLAINDMVRDKFVFSIRELTVKERLLREDKLTLEKVISMARASEASKEQVKAVGTKKQKDENQSVNEIRAGSNKKRNPGRGPRPGADSKKEGALFVVLLTSGDLVLLSAKRVIIARNKIILRVLAERECGMLAGKLCTPWLNQRAVIMTPIC